MTRVSITRPGHGSGCPWVQVRVTVRAPVTRAQPISKASCNSQRRPTAANEGQRRPTAANKGQCRPTKTKKSPNDARRVVWAIGRAFFSMYILFFIFLLLQSPRRPTAANDGQRRSTKAHSSQQRPMQAHEDEKGPKQRCLGPR